MTYSLVLAIFILPWTGILGFWAIRRGISKRAWVILLAHVALALFYTTPWDNYLVATGVWWYNPRLVTGLRLGWVPIEEYIFFVLQTLLTGFWYLVVRRLSPPQIVVGDSLATRVRIVAVTLAGLLWVASLALLILGWRPGTYLALILSWALLPVIVQLAFGADFLLARSRAVLLTIAAPTLYLWLVDALAISAGTWTISPTQTTGIFIGALPLEEMVFFLMTNTIITFGIGLMLSRRSQQRAMRMLLRARRMAVGQKAVLLWLAIVGVWLAVWIATPISLWLGKEGLFPLLASLGVLAQTSATISALWLRLKRSAQRDRPPAPHPGWTILLTSALVIGLSWSIEALGVSFGFPFGTYSYSPALQPQISNVPVIIPLAWLMMIIPAWSVTASILRGARPRLRIMYWPVFAILAGAAFTAWDLFLDPQMTARGLWSWQQPGGYFGIPWSNYAGWWLAGILITLVVRPSWQASRELLLVYTITWLFQALALGFFWGQPAPALIGFACMGAFAAWAWKREFQAWRYYSGLRSLSPAAPSPTP